MENMSYFGPTDQPENRHYLFGKGGGQKLAAQFDVPFLGEIPVIESISESRDTGVPIVMHDGNPLALTFIDLANRVAQQIAICNAKAMDIKVLVGNQLVKFSRLLSSLYYPLFIQRFCFMSWDRKFVFLYLSIR